MMHFRYARHTLNLKKLEDFYTSNLNLELLGNFDNHEQYNGLFLGKKNLSWHLEFTENKTLPQHHFDPDDLLVFYPEDIKEYNLIMQNINENNICLLQPNNPYWKENGIYIKDPDGFGIIISDLKIYKDKM